MSDPQEAKWYRVDRVLLRVKGFYFFTLGAIGDLLPFMALYMKEIGMTRSQAGIIYGLMPFVGFLVRPLFGAAADKFQRHKTLLCICCFFTGLSFNLMLVVPSTSLKHTKVKTEIMCSQADSFLRDCYHVNKTIIDQCPMTFHEYISKVKNSIITNLNNSENVPYAISTLPSATEPILGSGKECQLKCNVKLTSDLPQTVCFTNSTGMYDLASCNSVDVKSGKIPSRLNVALPDLEYVLNKEVVSDRIQIDDLICRDYDLKEVVYNEIEYWQMLCSDNMQFNCDLKCSHIDTCTETAAEDLSTSSFWLFFVLFLLGNIFFSPIMSLGDAIAYDLLGEEKRNRWGKQRLWGTIGFALFAMISTISMDTLNSNANTNNFSIAFYLFSALNICNMCVVISMRISHDLSSGGMLKGTLRLLRKMKVFAFILVLFYFGMLTGAIEAFLYWFLEADLGNKLKIIPGLCLLVSCTAETVVLFFAGFIIKRIGRLQCLYITFFAYALRFFFYSILDNPWVVLPIELLHSITFGLMWAAASSYASIITPSGMSGTIQGLISGVHFGFGKGVGSLVTGQLYTQIGMRWTFRIYSIVSLVFLVIYFILNKFVFEEDIPVTAEEEMKNIEKETEDHLLEAKDKDVSIEVKETTEYHDDEPGKLNAV